ncbi:MAG: MFS transporter [Parcubacteria group bacterium]|jgi:MFS family permease
MDYKWIVLSNTTLGVVMAAIDASIVLIALPAIFRGIGVDPLLPEESNYLLWTIMGYLLVTSVLLVTIGRISDMYGRVRLYNFGFLVFAVGSTLLYFIHGQGNSAAIQLIIFRMVQAVGGAFIFANSSAIITDAFPEKQRGLALGINQMAFLSGQFIGLVLGGVLAAIYWRYVFLVSIPFSVGGTVWAYYSLREVKRKKEKVKLDILGNILFAGGLTIFMVGFIYGIIPYGSSPMGWTNPKVIGAMAVGLLLLAAFYFVEKLRKKIAPMFRLELFRIPVFTAANVASFLSSLSRSGLLFMLIIWLQGIWLPLRGYDFADTPLWAGIFILPLTAGLFITGPIGGYFSDRFGSRYFTVGGMLVSALAFIGLLFLPINFSYPVFALIIFILGAGMGIFFSPNTAVIMNSVPPEHRGVASGMRSTFLNVSNSMGIVIVFALITIGLSSSLPGTLDQSLIKEGIPVPTAQAVSHLPPTNAIFAAFLGYNPLGSLVPGQVLNSLSDSARNDLLGHEFFPSILSGPFRKGTILVFSISAALSLFAALASLIIRRE